MGVNVGLSVFVGFGVFVDVGIAFWVAVLIALTVAATGSRAIAAFFVKLLISVTKIQRPIRISVITSAIRLLRELVGAFGGSSLLQCLQTMAFL